MAKNDKDKFSIGKVEVDILTSQEDSKHHVPKKFEYIIDTDNKDFAESVLMGQKKGLPVLIIGPTGTGKTSTIKYIASQINAPYRRIQLNGATGIEHMVGHYVLRNGQTEWQDGILTEAMRYGQILVLDEVNMALPEILAVLHSVMDDDRTLILDVKGGELVEAHPNFRIYATMNEDYAGTKELNFAFQDRFPIILRVNYPSEKKEIKILEIHTGLKDDGDQEKRSIVARMVEFANIIRKKNDEDKTIVFTCSTRQLINWGLLVKEFGVKKAAEATVLNKAEKEERKLLTDELNKLFKNAE